MINYFECRLVYDKFPNLYLLYMPPGKTEVHKVNLALEGLFNIFESNGMESEQQGSLWDLLKEIFDISCTNFSKVALKKFAPLRVHLV